MRLFTALELPATVRQAIDAWGRNVAGGFPAAAWVDESRLHVTLSFLSEVAADRVRELARGLRSALATRPPLTLEVGGGGVFPARGPARVLWLGVRCQGDLEGLYREAAGASAVADPAAGSRPFHPHVTAGRCRPPWPRREAERWRAAAPGSFAGPFAVRDAVLVRSELSSGGATHSVIDRFPLAGAPA